MKNQLFRASLFLAITAVVFCVRAFPQEVREEEKNEAEKTPEERERDKRTEDVLSGRAFLLSSDSMSRDIKRNMLRMKPNFNPTTFVTFGSGRGFNRKIAFKNNYWYSFFDVSSLDQPGIKDCYTDGDMFVLFGHVTWEDEHWFRSRDFPYVVVSRSSPKNADEYAKAAALTVKTFTPDNTILFDGHQRLSLIRSMSSVQ